MASSNNNNNNNLNNVNGVITPPSTPSPNPLQMNMAREREKYLEEYNFPFCEAATKYEKLAKIGQGTFGEVFKARDKKNLKRMVAMKKILMENEKEGFPITALREIRILQLLKHDNVVNLLEICQTRANQFNRYRSTFYLVFEFCEHDLAGLLSNTKVKFSLGEIKQVIQQMLNGLYYIHSNKILHRDMKAANVLITKLGTLKLADFGLARAFSAQKNGQPNRYTNRVVTLWYRPPELLLGDRNYGPPVDLWGAGCIMAEMWTRSPIMQGNSEQQQLTLISQLCGSITPDVWPKVESLDLYNQLELVKGQKRKVKERLKPYVRDPMGCDLIDKLLVLDPAKRFDADSALNHDFFWTDPMPCDLSRMLSQQTQSNFEYLAPRRLNNHQSSSMRPTSSTSSQSSSTSTTSGFHERVF
ncbi:Protein kinase domain,Protein kinase-like domain,Protein kinase, ATP binding site,Serine/threonine- [Cinara cedri]|uniref:Protein kinase domain,Protein kinase-like domain,Protein kinase, ATP binding site,Serine/threonine n=1 Tax=Cinara cedri TaxID=506608 RepID=A0A5E4NEB4_9HEMI|nr:Protein kinase domain,Protein kinase-like domain,Protein kinase, ATP binding site,Serine/threonine- [Cinara cedri]